MQSSNLQVLFIQILKLRPLNDRKGLKIYHFVISVTFFVN